MTGTKKQKMKISNDMVDAIYSMEPPGRFLKKCPGDSEAWEELSRRDAADKAAQAMAYIIKGESLKRQRRERKLRPYLPPPSASQPQDVAGVDFSPASDRPAQAQPQLHVAASVIKHHGGNSPSSAAHEPTALGSAAAGEQLPGNSNLQQHLNRLQQQPSTNTSILPSHPGIPLNNLESVQVLPSALTDGLNQQPHHNRYHEQQQKLLLPQHGLGSAPPNLSFFAAASPSVSDQGVLQNERYLAGSQQALNNNLLHNHMQPQPNNNRATIAHHPQGGQRLPLQTRTQFLISSLGLGNTSNDHFLLQRQFMQLRPDPRYQQWQAALHPSLSSLNSTAEMLSTSYRSFPFPSTSTSRGEESEEQRR